MLLKVSAIVEHRLKLGLAFLIVGLLDLLAAVLFGGWPQLFPLQPEMMAIMVAMALVAMPIVLTGRLVAAYLLTHPPQLGDLHENGFLLAFLPIALANIAALAVCALFLCLLLT